MKAALYARRSTTEHQAASLDVQVEEARRWCAARGWEVVATYLEDGVSRAEFVNRPALGKLLAGAADGLFEALVMRDDSRLGGDMYRTGMVLQDLHDAGVAVWYYASSERVSFDDPTAKLISAVKLYASETERLKITGRVREHLEHRARKGLNVGGRVYGYRNERTAEGVRYVVEPTEAAIVCEIFERHATGQGIRGIAKALNARGVPGPRPGRPWAPGGIHAMLRRERYAGVLEWGRVGAEYKGGTRHTIERPASERIRVERPELAIVGADLWKRAQARVVATAGAHTKRYGREPAYLLTGLGRCEACGKGLFLSDPHVWCVSTFAADTTTPGLRRARCRPVGASSSSTPRCSSGCGPCSRPWSSTRCSRGCGSTSRPATRAPTSSAPSSWRRCGAWWAKGLASPTPMRRRAGRRSCRR